MLSFSSSTRVSHHHTMTLRKGGPWPCEPAVVIIRQLWCDARQSGRGCRDRFTACVCECFQCDKLRS
jgi:hypothetical protein